MGGTSPAEEPAIRKLYFVHFSHADVGFTDQPSVCRELYRRYLDVAVDAALESRRGTGERQFFWTVESTIALADWWEKATAARRKDLLRAVRSGQMDVAALPFNQTPFLDAAQWRTMLDWLPPEVWRAVEPRVAVQNDVNGMPRAGAVALLDRGVTRLFMCINSDSGGPPLARPGAFWWRMPDGRRMFVWLNDSYPNGYFYFEPHEWRRGPVPQAADTRYRPPRAGDFLRTDEASLRAAHRHCLERLRALKAGGYPYEVLATAMTSQWRMDNDPPWPPLAEFVAAWNRLGLKPEIVFTTATRALEAMEKEIGDKIPEHRGEFTDWWANGTGSAPREVAASRRAKRFLSAAHSPLFGEWNAAGRAAAREISQDLCLFDEHTWGSSLSVALPDAIETRAQFAEKALLAYRPMARAEWLLSQRARLRWAEGPAGVIVANPSAAPFSGWVSLVATALREDWQSVETAEAGSGGRPGGREPLLFEAGLEPWGRPRGANDLSRENLSATFSDQAPRKVVKFWVDNLPPHSHRVMRFSRAAGEPAPARAGRPAVELDATGWPSRARWPGMSKPLFEAGLGDFLSVQVNGFAPPWILSDMANSGSARQRDELRQKHIQEVSARAQGRASVEETAHTLRYSQWLEHPRLRWCTRQLELWKGTPRARLVLRFDRLSSPAPEAFFAVFLFPCEGVLPRLSAGGMPFVPFEDQLPGSCRDYFAADGWAHYPAPDGHWLWVSRDAPLVTFDSPQVWTRRQTAPGRPQRLLSMLFNNFWYTNFAADENGAMEFAFDLSWDASGQAPANLRQRGEAAFVEPVVLINPSLKEDPRILRHLYTP